jgi:hypothetical protein
MYKDMLCVEKDANTGKMRIASPVWSVTGVDGYELFTGKAAASDHTFCFVTADPVRRLAHVAYFAYNSYW